MPPRRRKASAAAAAAADADANADTEMASAPAAGGGAAAAAADTESKEFLAADDAANVSANKSASGKGERKAADEKDIQKTLAKGFLHGVTNKDDLLRRLKKLSAILIDLQQDGPWGETVRKGVAAELARADMLRHKSNDVRLQVACCLADVLRLTAPEAPYDESELKAIFELFIAQLRGVTRSASPDLPKYFHLLESLAVIKTCLIIVDFESDDTLVKLFTNFFDMTKEEPNTITQFHMLDILASCVEETKEISVRLLDVLLRNICPPIDPHAFRMTQQLIQRSHSALEKPIHRFIRNVLPQKSDQPKNEEEETSSITDRKSQLHVIFELCLWCPQMLTSIIPLFQDALECEDKAERSSYVNLFGRVFVHEKSQLDTMFPPLYTAWVRRLHDNEVDIRVRMAEFMEESLIKRAPSQEIIHELHQRSQDPQDKVRARVVQAVCTAMVKRPHAVVADLIASVTERLMDKKANVRREAQLGLAKCFKQHCAEYWKRGEASDVGKRFSFAPRKILAQYAKTNVATDLLFDEEFLDVTYTLQERTRTFIGINAALDEKGRESLRNLLHDKAVAQNSLRDILKAKRGAFDASDAEEKQTHDKKKDQLMLMLARTLPLEKTKEEAGPTQAAQYQAQHIHLSALVDHKDKNVQKLLDKLIDPETEYKALREVKLELVKAVGSNKGPLTDFVKRLCTRVGNVLLPIDALKILFEQIHLNLSAKRPTLVESAVNVLRFVAGSFPKMLRHAAAELQKLFASGDAKILPVALEVLALIDLEITKPVAHDLLELLIDLMPKCHSAHVKHLIAAVLNLEKRSDADTFSKRASEMQQFLAEHLNETDIQLPVALEGYAALAKLALSKFEAVQEDDKVLQFVQEKLLRINPLAAAATKRKAPLPPDVLLQAKVAGVGLLSQYLAAIADREIEQMQKAQEKQSASKLVAAGQRGQLAAKVVKFDAKDAEEPARIVATLFAVIKDDGDISGELKAVKESGGLIKAEEKAPKKGKGKKKGDDGADGEPPAEADGAAQKTLELIETHEAELVLSAAKGLLSLCTKPQFPAAIWCEHDERMINLAMVMHHHQTAVRRAFAEFVLQEIRDMRLPFHFCILLAMTASEPVVGDFDMPKRMRLHLPLLMTRQRTLIDMHRQMYKGRSVEMPEHLRSPEFLLADLIHLLAHHSDFVDPQVPRNKPVRSNSLVRQDSTGTQPDSKERELSLEEKTAQQETFDYFAVFVSLFLDALLPKGADHDYTLLINILVQIKKCKIAGALPEHAVALNHNMYCLAEIAQLLLQKRSQDKWVAGHDQDVGLPKRLFTPVPDTESRNVRTRYLPDWYGEKLVEVKRAGGRRSGGTSAAAAASSKGTPKKAPGSASKRKRADDESGGTPSRRKTPQKKAAAAAGGGSDDDDGDADEAPRSAKKAKAAPAAGTRKMPERRNRGAPTQLSFVGGDSDDEAFERMLDSHEQEKVHAKLNGASPAKPLKSPAKSPVKSPAKPAAAAAAAAANQGGAVNADGDADADESAAPVDLTTKTVAATKPKANAKAAAEPELMRDDGDADAAPDTAAAKPKKAAAKPKAKGKGKGKKRGKAAAAAAAEEETGTEADAPAGADADADGDADMADAKPAPKPAATGTAVPKAKGKRK